MSDIKIIRQFIREYLVEVCGGNLEDVEDVISTANLAHLHDTRKSTGAPAITHPEAVAKIVKSFYGERDDLCLAAYLHDSLEDAEKLGNVSQAELINLIRGSIQDPAQSEKILSIIQDMTHDKEKQSYDEYFTSLVNKPDTLIVKLSDMLHNLRDNPLPHQALKYKKAIDSLDREELSYVSKQHWAALDRALKTALSIDVA